MLALGGTRSRGSLTTFKNMRDNRNNGDCMWWWLYVVVVAVHGGDGQLCVAMVVLLCMIVYAHGGCGSSYNE